MKELIKQLKMEEEYLRILTFKNTIPEDGNIPVDVASTLQTKCWLISADLTTLTTKAEVHEGKMKGFREDTLSDKKAECEEKAENAKERFAKSTPEYRTARDAYYIATALLNNLNSLKRFFENGVYVMRSRQDKEAKDWQATPTTEV